MIDRRLIFEIHRMANEGLSGRKIARALKLDRTTVARYLADPNPAKPIVIRASKLAPFRDLIQSLLDRDRDASATVVNSGIICHPPAAPGPGL